MTLKNKINFSLVIFSVLIISSVVFLIYPLFKEIKMNSEDLISKKQELLSLEAKVENLKEFQSLWPEIEPNLKKVDQLFIDSEVPVEFIGFLETTARDYGLSIEISPALSSETEKDLWPSLSFQISSTASFSKFLKFLAKIETSPYLIEIQSLNGKRLTERELELKDFEKFSLGDVKTTLSIKVYTK
jgi:Tfp pilus assembly protein PilO